MNEYPGLVDSHFHLLSLSEKGLDPLLCVKEFFEAGGRWALDVAVDAHHWEQRLAWAYDERVGLTTGIHPSEAERSGPRDLEAVEAQARHPRCLALGEIGLDWYRGRDQERAQRQWFRDQLQLAQRLNLPIVIHNREADREVVEDLDAVSWAGGGIMHCFSSDLSLARKALDRGLSLSFAGNLTYKTSTTLREVVAWAPLDRLLVETDAPYLPPQPVRGRPNRPLYAGLTAQVLAETRGIPLETVLRATGDNYGRLVGLVSDGTTDRG